jgi:FkbM family methyltransferase
LVSVFKRVIKGLVFRAGYDISKRYDVRYATRRSTLEDFIGHLRGLDFNPNTVIDVGVASGTPELYRGFSNSKHILIEPLEEFTPELRRIATKYNVEYVSAAAGAKPGKATFHVHTGDLEGSSLLRENDGPQVDGMPREVEVQTVDEICQRHQARGPMLLKVDVQGAEIEVLKGAEQTLYQTEVIVLECSLFKFQEGALELIDVIEYVRERGWAIYDLFGFRNRPLDGALAQLDVAFVQEKGRFRRSHRWAIR